MPSLGVAMFTWMPTLKVDKNDIFLYLNLRVLRKLSHSMHKSLLQITIIESGSTLSM